MFSRRMPGDLEEFRVQAERSQISVSAKNQSILNEVTSHETRADADRETINVLRVILNDFDVVVTARSKHRTQAVQCEPGTCWR